MGERRIEQIKFIKIPLRYKQSYSVISLHYDGLIFHILDKKENGSTPVINAIEPIFGLLEYIDEKYPSVMPKHYVIYDSDGIVTQYKEGEGFMQLKLNHPLLYKEYVYWIINKKMN